MSQHRPNARPAPSAKPAAPARREAAPAAECAASPRKSLAPAAQTPAPPSPSGEGGNLQAELKAKIEKAAHEIVDGLIAAAKGGGYMAAKFLFEFAGLFPAAAPQAASGEAVLLQQLLDRLGSTEL